jgi:hypothetical protein
MTHPSQNAIEGPSHDRKQYLYGTKRDSELSLEDVHAYGRENFGDPDFLSLYGLRPTEWYARGIRLLGRTAIECTRDILAQRIGEDIADVAKLLPANSPFMVIDLFAGSCNTLFWAVKSLPHSRGIGFEQNQTVFELTRSNLTQVDATLRIENIDFRVGLAQIEVPLDHAVAVIVSPPWGHALDPIQGLDLRKTTPSVPDVLTALKRAFPDRQLTIGVQTFETLVEASVTAVRQHFDWSELHTYHSNPTGKNSGLLVGTTGWAPPASAQAAKS